MFLQSSYELRCSKILDSLGVRWNRGTFVRYEMNERSKRYFPDFYLVDCDMYLDTKNDYLIAVDRIKIETVRSQTNVKLIVLSDRDITEDFISKLLSPGNSAEE